MKEGASRLAAERSWHDAFFAERSGRSHVLDPRILDRYLKKRRRPIFPKEMVYHLLGDVRGKNVLVLGCGDDNDTVILALQGARVVAFDLSRQAVSLQQKMGVANRAGLDLAVAAAEELPFVSRHFDVVVGSAILHHVPDALDRVAAEVARVLRPSGQAVFFEPVSFSPLLAALRTRLPAHTDLSPGERQLTREDLHLLKRLFAVKTYFFRLFSRFDRFTLPGGELEFASTWERLLTRSIYALDSIALTLPLLHRFAGSVVLKLKLTPSQSRSF
jgi:SAM-dependent methyltransferase